MDTVDFYGEVRSVTVAEYLMVGSTIYGVAKIDGVTYTLTRQRDSYRWKIVRRWS